MKVAVFGSGYVGLVTAVCLADFGNTVYCIDIDLKKIEMLNARRSPIYEPGLLDLIHKNLDANRIVFTTDAAQPIKDADIIFIAVGTPPMPNGEADISNVLAVAAQIGRVLSTVSKEERRYKVIINKSTVPVGMGKRVQQAVEEAGLSRKYFGVVSNPEFLREGSALDDFFHPDRIVVGSEDEKALEIVKALYRPFYLIEKPILVTNLETAELIKYASNAFLATKISFINEMAAICDRVGADVNFVSKGMGMDNRIGRYFLHPGPGYGGSCFPKDTQALIHIADQAGYDLKIVKAVEAVNKDQKLVAVEKIRQVFGENLKGITIGVLGLAFKPNTDDMRDAPALAIISELLKFGAAVKVFDPESMPNTQRILGDVITYAKTATEALANADAMLLLTEWNEFRHLQLETIKKSLKQPVIIDMRNVFDPESVKGLGFRYCGIGRQ